ncbi:MAG: 4-hydroxythreonine-4-phosphate dehydrogenase PdxA [Azospirillum sp.]|nr:4-hydroxythreonine-4-phosphate dehydrogenase PdxA [Azospirillum sp.]
MEALPLALTMGEPAGIGGEIALKAWTMRHERTLPPFVVVDDPARLQALSQAIGLAVPIQPIDDPAEAVAIFTTALPVVPIALPAPVRPGQADPGNSSAVIGSIDRAVALVRAGRAAAVVTNPIQKSALFQAGFTYPGHTEYLATLADTGIVPVMMLEGDGLRVVPVTTHISLRDSIAALSIAGILHCARVTAAALTRDFGVESPRIAVAGLNPHAGEAGMLGSEEIDLIAPAVVILQAEGIKAFGPRPADSLFHPAARAEYDAAICMYHDQALIPLKTLVFESGVNITLGLPFVRTSPDHGTALDIAGTGRANPASLIAAIRTADRMVKSREAFDRPAAP